MLNKAGFVSALAETFFEAARQVSDLDDVRKHITPREKSHSTQLNAQGQLAVPAKALDSAPPITDRQPPMNCHLEALSTSIGLQCDSF
jgi:hypothetical protein